MSRTDEFQGCEGCRYNGVASPLIECGRLDLRGGTAVSALQDGAVLGGAYVIGRTLTMLAHGTAGLISPSCFVEARHDGLR